MASFDGIHLLPRNAASRSLHRRDSVLNRSGRRAGSHSLESYNMFLFVQGDSSEAHVPASSMRVNPAPEASPPVCTGGAYSIHLSQSPLLRNLNVIGQCLVAHGMQDVQREARAMQ